MPHDLAAVMTAAALWLFFCALIPITCTAVDRRNKKRAQHQRGVES